MRVYVDNAATTYVKQKTIEAMIPYMNTHYGNPSSVHKSGITAKNVINNARKEIREIIGATITSDIIFTSGGTEADNQALITAAKYGLKKGKRHIITSSIEHQAVLNTLHKLEKEGFEITYLYPNRNGIIELDDLKNSIRLDTFLVSIMALNNEIGSIQPLKEIGEICSQFGILFHTDAVQAIGHIVLNVDELGIDMLSASAHKFNGPKGIGFLYIKEGINVVRCIEGGHQQQNARPGTENVPGIVGMTVALKDASQNLETNTEKIKNLSNLLIENLKKIPHSCLNGGNENYYPGIINFCFEGIDGETLVYQLDEYGIEASTGSACMSGIKKPSYVLTSLGLSNQLALNSLRISISAENTIEEINYLITIINDLVYRLRMNSIKWQRKVQRNNYELL